MDKKLAFVVLFLIILPFLAFASDSKGQELSNEQKLEIKQNLLLGFGAGSRRAGNEETAEKLKSLDITGVTFTVIGGVSLAVTDFFYDIAVASYGRIPKVDYYISSAILATGLGLLIGSRIASVLIPMKNFNASACITNDGVALMAQVRF